MSSLLRFAGLELDLRRYELRRAGRVLNLEKIPMDLLVFLVEERGRLVTRAEIIDRVWGKDVFVDTESAINTAVRKVRQALKDDPARPRVLETVPGRGYRFIAEVTFADQARAATPPASGVIRENPEESLPAYALQPLSRQAGAGSPSAPPEATIRTGHGRRRLMVASCAAGALLLLGLGAIRWRNAKLWRISTPAISSLAVLPLEDLSGDPSQEYFSVGLTDELITDLAKLRGLRIVSRTSAMHYKSTHNRLPEIADELNVDAVVEGTVLRSGSRVRIRVQLIDARTDYHMIWAEAYERDVKDVLSLQREVASNIAQQINRELSPQQKARFGSAPPASFEAYTAYLKGRYEWNKRTPDSLRESVEDFEEAIAKDPNYALAHEGLAEVFVTLSQYDVLSPAESSAKAKAQALKALELDDGLGEAHATLAGVKEKEWDWQGAEKEFNRALDLSPGSATTHQWYGEYLFCVGRIDQALAEAQLAQNLDPGSPLMNAQLGAAFYWARQYDNAIVQLRKTNEMQPGFPLAHSWLGYAYEQKGMRQEAIVEFRKAVNLSGGMPFFKAGLAHGYGRSGDRREARRMAEELKALFRSKQIHVSPGYLVLAYAGMGEKDEALDWLEKAYAQHDPILGWIKVSPALDSLRLEPRFQALVQRIGLAL